MRKVYALALAVLFLVVVGSLYFVLVRPSTVTEQNLERVENGMTKEKVIAILGYPDTARFKGAVNQGTEVWNEGRDPKSSGGAMIHVDFDANQQVVGKVWFPPYGPSPPGSLERFIRWFEGK